MGFEFRVSGSRCNVSDFWFLVLGLAFRVAGLELFPVSGFGVRIQSFGFGVLGNHLEASQVVILVLVLVPPDLVLV